MSFLAPLFLLGAAAIALPVIFHLVRRTTRHRTPFSSILFLSPTPPRLTRRSRIEDLLLLLLRCLALGLLAFGFARPFLRDQAAADPLASPPERALILVDVSASMRREGLWDAARQRVEAIARDAAPGDELAVWAFDRSVRTILSFEDWQAAPAGDRAALVAARLAPLQPGWSATHADIALVEAAESFVEGEKEGADGPRRLILVSDLQDGARTERLQSFDWPKGLQVTLEPLKPRRPGNAGLQWVAEDPHAAATTQAVVRLRVVNTADSAHDRFEVGWAAPEGRQFLGKAEEVRVPPGQNRVVTLSVPVASDPPTRVLLLGDDEPFDNEVWVVPPSTAPRPAVYLGGESADDPRQPLYFLRRAFPATGGLALDWRTPRPGEPLPSADLAAAALIVVTDVLSPDDARRVGDAVRAGHTLLFAPRSATAMSVLAAILDLPALPATEVQPSGYALLAGLDFGHPLLAPFADARYSDFTRIHFWKYRRFNASTLPGAHVIARFDSGDPAWVEIPAGRGRALVLASGWHPDDSQLALSTKFVPLLASTMERDLGLGMAPRTAAIGDDIPIVPPIAATGGEVRLPNGEVVPLPAGTGRFTTTVPGIHALKSGESVLRFAANVDATETRTEPLPAESWEALGTPLEATALATPANPARQRQLAAVEMESRQKLWRWLVAATLIVLLVETILAGWRNRRLSLQEATP